MDRTNYSSMVQKNAGINAMLSKEALAVPMEGEKVVETILVDSSIYKSTIDSFFLSKLRGGKRI